MREDEVDGVRGGGGGNAIFPCLSQSLWSILQTPQKAFFNTLGDVERGRKRQPFIHPLLLGEDE